MKAAKITLAGQDYYLVFNGAAMFAFEDAFGGVNAYLEKAAAGSREGFEAVCEAAAILAEQGELARRALGYDKGPIPDKALFLTCATPSDLVSLRQSSLDAILAGFGREVESEEDVDLGLLELERKKGKE